MQYVPNGSRGESMKGNNNQLAQKKN